MNCGKPAVQGPASFGSHRQGERHDQGSSDNNSNECSIAHDPDGMHMALNGS
jgi:hypothetical protein